MSKSNATTVDEYLNDLPEERREVMATVRKMVLKNLPKGYRESISWGMINYEIPLEDYPDTYNKQPLSYVSLAAQKNHYALYLICTYQDPKLAAELEEAFQKAGKKMDMGKSCLRFKKLEDIPLEAIGKIIKSTPPKAFIAQYEKARER